MGIQAYSAAYPGSLSSRRSPKEQVEEQIVLENIDDTEEVKVEAKIKKRTSR